MQQLTTSIWAAIHVNQTVFIITQNSSELSQDYETHLNWKDEFNDVFKISTVECIALESVVLYVMCNLIPSHSVWRICDVNGCSQHLYRNDTKSGATKSDRWSV